MVSKGRQTTRGREEREYIYCCSTGAVAGKIGPLPTYHMPRPSCTHISNTKSNQTKPNQTKPKTLP